MSRGPDAGVRLERALIASAAQAGCAITITDATWVRWASATFTGARHRVWLAGDAGPALDRWLAGLAEAELSLRESLVADLSIASMVRVDDQTRITVEALTVEA